MTIARIQSHFAMTRSDRLRPGRSVVIGLLLCEFAPRGVTRYPVGVAETAAIRFGDRNCSKADSRRRAVFLRPYTLCLQWSGLGGGAFAHAGFLGRRFANPVMCPATPFGDGGRVRQPV